MRLGWMAAAGLVQIASVRKPSLRAPRRICKAEWLPSVAMV